MIDLHNHKIVKFYDVATIERSQQNKVYDEDCILIQVSATNGQLVYLDKPQSVDSKYAVIKPKENVYGKYLYFVLEEALPDFLQVYQTGLNINPEIFKYLQLDMHQEMDTQKYVCSVMHGMDDLIQREADFINYLKAFKEYHLDTMFVNQ